MNSRRTTIPALAALALVLAGCGGSGEPDATPSSQPSSSMSTDTSASETGATDPSAGATEGSYLPVPSGVTLDEPGSTFELKESATAAWSPRQDLVGVVDVAIARITQTTVKESLSGFQLAGPAKRSTPYFVNTRVTNVGNTDLGARQLPLYVTDTTGGLIAPTGVARNFAPCSGSTLPAIFAPDDSAQSCLIFLVPEGATLESVMFRPPEGVVPLTWTGDFVTLKPPKKPGKSGQSGKPGKPGKPGSKKSEQPDTTG